jgi:CheY-like chemotaxis protein
LPAVAMDISSHLRKPRLLVVDDDRDLVDALCEWVSLNSDWTSVAAYGPAEAITRARMVHPDAVLLDMEMGGVDGFDTADRLDVACGSDHPPLFALTGNPRLRDAAAEDNRFSASMLKPANLEGLLRLLEQVRLPH